MNKTYNPPHRCDIHNRSDAVCSTIEHTMSLADLVGNLYSILSNGEHKHTPYIMVRKEVVLPILEDICARVNNGTTECKNCQLYKRAENERVALATVDRLWRHADSKDSVVTTDEAINLYNMLTKNACITDR